jgi:hypothetical protein
VRFYERLVGMARAAIVAGRFDAWRGEFLAGYAGKASESD